MGVPITVAFSENPRIQPLKEGIVKPQGIDLNWLSVNAGWIFHNSLIEDPWDLWEMSISSTLLAISRRGDSGRWDWSGLPVCLTNGGLVWTQRIYVNTASGINKLSDIKGKRVGLPDYEMTAGLWMRKAMKDLYGIEAKDNIWYNGRPMELSRDPALGIDKDPVPGVERHWLTMDQSLDVMLDKGELDVAFAITAMGPDSVHRGDSGEGVPLQAYGNTKLEGNPNIRPLFDDGGRAHLAEYYQKTGCQQPNHHPVIQNRILREHPWVALELVKAFQLSKEIAYERARKYDHGYAGYLYFEGNDFKRQAEELGPDPYPVGMRGNRKTLEAAIQASLEQGLIRKPMRLEDVYFHTTMDT